MYGCLLMEPVDDEADFSVLFLHNQGYSTMCGHGIIALSKVILSAELYPTLEPETTLRIETPAGLVTSTARIEQGEVVSISFTNVPSFVEAVDQRVSVPGFGAIDYDLAYGGAYYAFVKSDGIGLKLEMASAADLIRAATEIKRAIVGERTIIHPQEEDLSFLYGVIFVGEPTNPAHHSRHVCVFADGELDRSPTGTGVSARLALLHERGELDVGERVVIESIIDSRFEGWISDVTTTGSYRAVRPVVSGRAFITGRHVFTADPRDPFRNGFLVR